MPDVFHWVIFAFHFSAAVVITFGVLFRCDPDVWVSKMSVDTYKVQVSSAGLWWHNRDYEVERQCSLLNSTQSKDCFNADLPLYEKFPGDLGWHLFVLLAHFEWISAAFAFFYVEYPWDGQSWWVSCVMSVLGTVLVVVRASTSGTVYSNELVLVILNCLVSINVFVNYRSIHFARQSMGGHFRLSGVGNLEPQRLLDVQLPALRFCEYCITASELWVAVLCVFVQDPPAFMTLGGYTLILITNLYGLLLHYSLASDNLQGYLASPALEPSLPSQLNIPSTRKVLRVPQCMLGAPPAHLGDAFRTMMQRRVWGSYIASNTSTLLNSWLAYLVSVAIIFYQQTFLFSSEPPIFVVFAGWSLLLSYSSFGIWMTIVYWYPEFVSKLCFFVGDKELYSIAVYGLDVLSLASKLSIVGSLSYGFIFREEGRC